MRGIATFPLRMKAHAENALKVALFLVSHPKVKQVIYQGLPSHPQYELALRQMNNFSGLLTFQSEIGREAASLFAKNLQIFHFAISPGLHRFLIFFLPNDDLPETTFKFITSEQLESWKSYAGNGIFRFSVGLEYGWDIIYDLKTVLDKT
jgi:cystathionine beta-lyase/cystathionine gamma-synthase